MGLHFAGMSSGLAIIPGPTRKAILELVFHKAIQFQSFFAIIHENHDSWNHDTVYSTSKSLLQLDGSLTTTAVSTNEIIERVFSQTIKKRKSDE